MAVMTGLIPVSRPQEILLVLTIMGFVNNIPLLMTCDEKVRNLLKPLRFLQSGTVVPSRRGLQEDAVLVDLFI